MRLLGRRISLRVTRAHREVSETKPMQQLTDAALMQVHTKGRGNFPPQVAATPAHDAVSLKHRSSTNPTGDFALLWRRQLTWCAATVRAAKQTGDPFGVVAVNPVPQRLALHSGLTRRRFSTLALQKQRNCQHSSRRSRILRTGCLPSQISRRQLQPRDLHRHRCLNRYGDDRRITPSRAAPTHS